MARAGQAQLKNDKGLTHLQQAFCLEYVKDKNATDSVVRAGYSRTGASARASALLRVTAVAREIDTLLARKHRENRWTKRLMEEKYEELMELALKQRKVAEAKGCMDSIARLNSGFTDKIERVGGDIQQINVIVPESTNRKPLPDIEL